MLYLLINFNFPNYIPIEIPEYLPDLTLLNISINLNINLIFGFINAGGSFVLFR